jgi:hypothetical protein
MSELAEWVDGKAFAAWLEGRRPDLMTALSENQQRTLYRLKTEDGRGSLDVVDRFCVTLSLHINEIPEWIWTENKPGFGRRRLRKNYSQKTRDLALTMIRNGSSMKDVSEVLNVPLGTVKGWSQNAAK